MDKVIETILEFIGQAFGTIFGFIGKALTWPFTFLAEAYAWVTSSFGVDLDWLIYPVLSIFFIFLVTRIDMSYSTTIAYALLLIPFLAPFAILPLFYKIWMRFIHAQFAISQGQTILEVVMPREVFKTAEAMEQVFMQLYQKAGPDNWVQGLWDGKSSPSFSFEIVSTGGAIHFYIVTPQKKFKNLIETQLYAHYPGIEIREVALDYTAEIPSDLEGYSLMGFHFGKGGAQIGPPIRTYVDWGHLDTPKEEYKIDPMSVMVDALANTGPDEHAWMQFVIVPNKKYDWKTGSLIEKPDASKEIEADFKKRFSTIVKKKDADGNEVESAELKKVGDMSDYEKMQYNSYRRNINKYYFNTRIRGIYVAKKERFNGDRIALLAGCTKGTDVPGYSGIAPSRFRTDVDWPWWQNRGGRTVARLKTQILGYYKNRSMKDFEDDYGAVGEGKDLDSVLSTEELATLWHIPSSTVATPTLSRIESTRREAPSNLPI